MTREEANQLFAEAFAKASGHPVSVGLAAAQASDEWWNECQQGDYTPEEAGDDEYDAWCSSM